VHRAFHQSLAAQLLGFEQLGACAAEQAINPALVHGDVHAAVQAPVSVRLAYAPGSVGRRGQHLGVKPRLERVATLQPPAALGHRFDALRFIHRLRTVGGVQPTPHVMERARIVPWEPHGLSVHAVLHRIQVGCWLHRLLSWCRARRVPLRSKKV
jgi:hypothetical protein